MIEAVKVQYLVGGSRDSPMIQKNKSLIKKQSKMLMEKLLLDPLNIQPGFLILPYIAKLILIKELITNGPPVFTVYNPLALCKRLKNVISCSKNIIAAYAANEQNLYSH